MKLLILDGTFGNYKQNLLENIIDSSFSEHQVDVFKIEEKKIAFCTGCWSCWVKTPGLCIHMDDTHEMLRKIISSDMVIHFTENSVGYVTSNTKKALDKHIPLVHPYIELVNGECHHLKRYDRYPQVGLIYVDDSLNEGDFHITKHLLERAALNFKTELSLAVHITSNTGELKHDYFNF